MQIQVVNAAGHDTTGPLLGSGTVYLNGIQMTCPKPPGAPIAGGIISCGIATFIAPIGQLRFDLLPDTGFKIAEVPTGCSGGGGSVPLLSLTCTIMTTGTSSNTSAVYTISFQPLPPVKPSVKQRGYTPS
jgi:hypothetical protein